jgi:hypothetical protein
MVEITRHPDDHAWETHVPRAITRVLQTSCCGEYEWCCEGGMYVVLRGDRSGGHQETGRSGLYAEARGIWDELVMEHRGRHGTAWAEARRRDW